MSLNNYGFVDNVYMKSKTFDVSVSSKDKIIQVMDGNVLLASLSMALNNNILSLIGKDNAVVAEVELPQSKLIKNIIYDDETKQIIIEIIMEDGSESEIVIDVPDLVTIYEGCNGIEVEGNKIGIKINENSSKYLSADDSGLSINMESLDETFVTDESLKNYATLDELEKYATKIELEDYAKKTDLDGKADKTELVDMATQTWVKEQNYLTEHQDISALATKVEVDEKLAKKVDWTDISTEENPNRKCIVLNNHDTVLGTDTSGNTRSIIMVSKWDKVDVGTSTLPINLNTPKDVRPTVQEAGQTGEEAHQIAYLSDIEELIISSGSSLETILQDYAKKNHNHDDLYSKLDHNHDTMYSNINHNHDNLYSDLEHKHDDLYSKLDHNHNDLYAQLEHNHDGVYAKLIHNHDLRYSKILHNHDTIYSKLDHQHNQYLTSADIANKVDWTSYEYNGFNRKSIVLDIYDSILGTNSSGKTVNLAMVSKWDVVDLGTPLLPINLNTPQGKRPTVQEAGQTGEEAHQIAYLSDIENIESDFSNILNNYVTKDNLSESLLTKQDKLIAGDNISIDNNTISCTIDNNIFIIAEDGILPLKGDPNKIYLVYNQNESQDNRITEYYYTEMFGWEKIGEYKENIDLSQYVTKTQWSDEIPACVESKFNSYTTLDTVNQIVSSNIAIELPKAVSEANNYTDTQIISVKNYCQDEIKKGNDEQNKAIASNSDRIVALENRCNHFDDLFKQLLIEHGDGTLELNTYTKSECDEKFATKTDIEHQVEWVEYDYVQPTSSINPLVSSVDKISELEKTIELLKNKINDLEKLLINKGN